MAKLPKRNGDPNAPRRPRRWFQFGLSTLLAVTALAAGGAMAWRAYVEPYRRQRETMALVKKLGGSCETTAADQWLRRMFGDDFQNITSVDLAVCGEPERYIDQVASLPALETLVVAGPAFADDHLRRLHGLATLRKLVLDCTGVSAAGIDQLHGRLPKAEVWDYNALFDALLRDVLTTSDLKDSRDFYGTPGGKEFALAWGENGHAPWRRSYQPHVEGFQGRNFDESAEVDPDSPRLLGVSLDVLALENKHPGGPYNPQIRISLSNVGGSGGEPIPIGGCLVFYKAELKGHQWVVTYTGCLDP
jgi:hypothetical protein